MGLLLIAVFPTVHHGAEEKPEREFRFTVFCANPMESLSFIAQEKFPPTPVAFYPTARSPVYTYRGDGPIRFYRTTGPVEEHPPAALEVNFPAHSNQFLFLFVRITNPVLHEAHYRVHVIDDSAAARTKRSLSILNLSGLELRGQLAGKEINLSAGEASPIRVSSAVRLELRTPFRGRLYPAYSETIDLRPEQRGLLILFPPWRIGSLEVQSRLLVDDLPETTPKDGR